MLGLACVQADNDGMRAGCEINGMRSMASMVTPRRTCRTLLTAHFDWSEVSVNSQVAYSRATGIQTNLKTLPQRSLCSWTCPCC